MIALSELLQIPDIPDEESKDCLVLFASEILIAKPDYVWDSIWSLMQQDPEIGKRFYLTIAYGFSEERKKFIEQLSDVQLADLYIWLMTQFPFEDDPDRLKSGAVTPLMDVVEFRNVVLNYLSKRGTLESVREVERVVKFFPQYHWLQSHLLGSRDLMIYKTWIPPYAEDVFKLISHQDNRYIQTGDQLLYLLKESLQRLQSELHSKIDCAQFLWDGVNRRNRKQEPIGELGLSDYIASYLERDLKEIIVNREVQVHRKSRTDIQVDVNAKRSDGTVTGRVSVVIEVKGCWHADLEKAMKSQLLNQYLTCEDLNHGIYLVGWFYCDAWLDSRGPLKNLSLTEAKSFFNKQAEELSDNNKQLCAVVLDASLNKY